MTPIKLTRYRGDTIQFTVGLIDPDTGAAFTPGLDYNLLYTLTEDTDNGDAACVAQKTTGTGISVTGSNATIDLVGADTESYGGKNLVWSIRATHVVTGARKTVAVGTMRVEANTGRETTPSVTIYTTDPSDAFESTSGAIAAASTKDAIVDGDLFPYADSEASGVLVKTAWSNIKSKLATYFGTLFDSIGSAAAAQAAAIQRANHTGTQAQSTVVNLESDLSARVLIADIRNVLTSVETDKPLSAAQGKVLKDAIDAINTLLGSDELTLDTLQEIVDFIQLNRADLDALSIASIAGLQAALDTKLEAASSSKTTPVDADTLDLQDSAASGVRKLLSFANLWAWIKGKIESVALAALQITGDVSVKGGKLYLGTIDAPPFAYDPAIWMSDRGSILTPSSTNYFVRRDTSSHLRFKNAFSNRIYFEGLSGEIGYFYDSGLYLGSGKYIVFAGGNWNGSTFAGPQDFSGQVTLTGQAASSDSAAMNRGLVMELLAKSANVQTFPAFVSGASGTGASATLNSLGLGFPSLTTGTAAGSYAYAHYSFMGMNDGSGSGVNFANEFYCSGWFRCSLGDTGEGVHRFLIGADSSPTEKADEDAFSDEGLGFEIRGAQGGAAGTYARLIYHDGTTYKQSAWAQIATSSSPFIQTFSYALHNVGDGNVALYIATAGQWSGPMSLINLSPIASASDGPTNITGAAFGYVSVATANHSTNYTASVGTIQTSPMKIVVNP